MACSVTAQSFPALRWQRFYGHLGDETACRLLQLQDGSLLLAGSTPGPGGLPDGYLLRVNAQGDKLWERSWGGVGPDIIQDLAAADSLIYFTGTTGSSLNHTEKGSAAFAADYWTGALRPYGNLRWEHSYGGPEADRGLAVAAKPAGGCLVAGNAWSGPPISPCAPQQLLSNTVLLRYSTLGVAGDTLCYGGNQQDVPFALVARQGGGYYLAGITTSTDVDMTSHRPQGDAWIAKLDVSGQRLWTRYLRQPQDERIYRIVEPGTGGAVLAGSRQQGGQRKYWLVKYSSAGELLWQRSWGTTPLQELTGLANCKDGGFILTGYSYSTAAVRGAKGGYDLWVMRTTAEGQLLWQQAYGGPGDEQGVDVVEALPGRYVVLGVKQNHFEQAKPAQGKDLWLLQVQELSCDALQATFTCNAPAQGQPLAQALQCTYTGQYAQEYLWSFGDGTTSTAPGPFKRYSRPGKYQLSLTVKAGGCTATYSLPAPVLVVDE